MATKTNENVYAEIVLRSKTGASLVRDVSRFTAERIPLYLGSEESAAELQEKLKKAGFKIIAATQFGVSITGPEKLYNDFFKAKIVERPAAMFFGGGKEHVAPAFFMDAPATIPNDVSNLAEHLYIPRRGYFLAGEGPMPTPNYYHLRPPADISRLTNADAAQARNFRGTGVKVAMVDSGFIANHDYYAGRGYNITVHAAVGNVNVDEYGHGTGIASCLLAIAPECEFHFFKMSDGQQWASLAAFRMAVQAGVKVITCSWGQGRDPVLEAEIVSAVSNGITVIFACGNGGPIGWPGYMPEVISVGGAFPRQDGTWEASSYASSGVHPNNPARHVPDLSAIVGQAPRGIFIVVPTMQGAIFDDSFGGGVFPNGDQTAKNDGWMVASGTSSAAPMVAGAAALLLQCKSSLTPAEIRQTLANTCIDVVQGASASGEPAGVGPDSPTGAGMINVGAAIDSVCPPVCLRAPLPCLRAPSCLRGPNCPRAPLPCLRGPNCPIAPLPCLRAPIQCTRAPLDCIRAPLICRVAPVIDCPRAPIISCQRAPIEGCLAGPLKKPEGPIDEPEPIREKTGRLVPVVVMVDEARVDEWMAMEEAYEIGMGGEYDEFPQLGGCRRGPFDPSCR